MLKRDIKEIEVVRFTYDNEVKFFHEWNKFKKMLRKTKMCNTLRF